jgi:DNA-binding SARP family transcriptional activator
MGGDVTIELLPRLRIQVRGEEVALPARRKARALLTLLAWRAGETISADELVDDLWTAPPRTAIESIHVYVGLVRRCVGELLVTDPDGYRLALARHKVDVHSDGFDLAAYSPPLLAEYAEEPALAAAGRTLDELHLEATLRWAAASPSDPALAARLRALGEANPYNEAVCVARAEVAWRRGDQVAALSALRTLARRLWDELGLIPGECWRDLERRILRGDAVTTTPWRATAATSVSGLTDRVAALADELRWHAPREAAEEIDALSARLPVAFDWLEITGRREQAARLAVDLRNYFLFRGRRGDGARLAVSIREAPSVSGVLRARALYTGAWLTSGRGSNALLSQVEQLVRSLDDPLFWAWVQVRRGHSALASAQGSVAREHAESALGVFGSYADLYGIAEARLLVARVAIADQEASQAVGPAEEVLLAMKDTDAAIAAHASEVLAAAAAAMGSTNEAVDHLHATVRGYLATGRTPWVINALRTLGRLTGNQSVAGVADRLAAASAGGPWVDAAALRSAESAAARLVA